MTTSSLRRSQRVRRPSFKEGDLIEIVRNKGISIGRLLHKIEDSSPRNPFWVVTFDDEDTNDEEICEKSFGRLIQSGTVSSRKNPRSRSENSSVETATNSEASLKRAHLSDSQSTNGRKAKIINKDNIEDTKSTNENQKNENHESEDVGVEVSSTNVSQTENGISTRSTASGKGNRKTTVSAAKGKPKSANRRCIAKKAKKAKEQAVKVKLLTGTLYLYRGENPRAEFIRHR